MTKSTLFKEFWRSLGQTKGRFLSMVCLMMLGSFALVGLQAAPPDIRQTASTYLEGLRVQDLTVLSDYGLSQEDMEELAQLSGAQVEGGYLTDVVLDQTPEAWRIFSLTQDLAHYQLVAGRLPQASGEIALLSSLQGRFQLGDTVKLKESGNAKAMLKQTTFTITGFVNSGELGNQVLFGPSTAGSGTLAGYGVVTAQDFDSPVYTLARLRYEDLAGLNTFEARYWERLDQHQADLEALLADNGAARLAQVQSQVQSQIDQGQSDLDSASEALASGSSQLASAESQWADQSSALDQAASQWASQDETLTQGQGQLASAQAALAQAKSQLESGAAALTSGQANLTAKSKELAQAKSQLDAAKSQLDSQAETLASQSQALAEGQAKLAAGQQALATQEEALRQAGQDPDTQPDIQAARQALADQAQTLASAKSQLEVGQAQWQAANTSYQEGLARYQAGAAALATGQAQYDSQAANYEGALAQYQAGQAQYDSQSAAAQAGAQALESASQEISSGQEALASARQELDDQQAEFASKEAEAQASLKEGQTELDQARDSLAGLVTPKYRVYSRQTYPGDVEFYTSKLRTEGMSNVGNIFPVVLYLVAALVTLTTMTRFMSEERLKAGLLQALGYGSGDILAKFLLYGLLSSGLGALLGIVAGTYGLPYVLGHTLFATSTYPPIQLHFYWQLAALALGLSFLSSLLPIWWVARRELAETPAQLLLTKPPARGSRILLERVTWFWRRLTFTQKVAARNIFRYKQRMLMTILGVAGSVALLFAGLGISSSLAGITERQFDQLVGYDLIVARQQHVNTSQEKDLAAALAQPDLAQTLDIQLQTGRQHLPGFKDQQEVTIMVAPDGGFGQLMAFYDAYSHNRLDLPDRGALISQKMADKAGLKVGDRLTLEDPDGQPVSLEVAGIVELYAGHNVYLSRTAYEAAYGKAWTANAHLVQLTPEAKGDLAKVSAHFMDLSGVRSVIQNSGIRHQIQVTVDSLALVMQILTLVSVLLAAVILYNLTTINVAERIRELSTIKVLGFHNREVTRYIYRETVALSLVGILFGLAGGWVLHRYLLARISADFVRFNQNVAWTVYLTPVVAILLILAALGWLVNRQLRQVDMLEALKSVD